MFMKRDKSDDLQNAACNIFGYNGTKLKAELAKDNIVQLTDMYWHGGTKSFYAIIELATMNSVPLPSFHPMFDGQVLPDKVELKPGYVLVRHIKFCGSDLGLEFIVHADDWKNYELPVPTELNRDQKVVLLCTKCYISSYRREEAKRYGIKDFDAIKSELIAKGLLSKIGALTVEGKNVASTLGDIYSYSKR